MKKLAILLFLLCLASATYSQQKVLNISDLKQQGISMRHLDSLYQATPSDDTIHPVFNKMYFDTIVHLALSEMFENINKSLVNKGFKWATPVECINRVYFNTSGKIDFYIYIFHGMVGEEMDVKFKEILTEFIANYKLPVVAPVKFSITEPVMFSHK